jgi:hypothetical protein
MARLMVVPIRNRGDSVLIMTRRADVELVGFVARRTLSEIVGQSSSDRSLSNCQCISIVKQNLDFIEQVLFQKSRQVKCADGTIPCVEICADDLDSVVLPG